MTSINHKRRESDYFQIISEIINNDLSNSNISNVTVTGVKLAKDNSLLTVYLVFSNNEQKSLAAINKAKSFVRLTLGNSMEQRIVPKIIFEIDASARQGRRIDDILASLKK